MHITNKHDEDDDDAITIFFWIRIWTWWCVEILLQFLFFFVTSALITCMVEDTLLHTVLWKYHYLFLRASFVTRGHHQHHLHKNSQQILQAVVRRRQQASYTKSWHQRTDCEIVVVLPLTSRSCLAWRRYPSLLAARSWQLPSMQRLQPRWTRRRGLQALVIPRV